MFFLSVSLSPFKGKCYHQPLWLCEKLVHLFYTVCRFLFFTVVTGSSEGIGRAYARELASRGLNLVLISKPENRLYRAAKQIGIHTVVRIFFCSCKCPFSDKQDLFLAALYYSIAFFTVICYLYSLDIVGIDTCISITYRNILNSHLHKVVCSFVFYSLACIPYTWSCCDKTIKTCTCI